MHTIRCAVKHSNTHTQLHTPSTVPPSSAIVEWRTIVITANDRNVIKYPRKLRLTPFFLGYVDHHLMHKDIQNHWIYSWYLENQKSNSLNNNSLSEYISFEEQSLLLSRYLSEKNMILNFYCLIYWRFVKCL